MVRAVEVAVVVLGLMAMIQQSMQLSLRNPAAASVIERMHGNLGRPGPLGVIVTSQNNEQALNDSNYFTADSSVPSVQVAGRTFHIGKINGADVVYVLGGGSSINAAIASQILIDTFDVDGIVLFGSAGTVNDSLSIGSVSVPHTIVYTGSWQWLKFGSSKGDLKFGRYNYPKEGENLLASITYEKVNLYVQGQSVEEVMSLPVSSSWLQIASQLKDLQLEKCVDSSNCVGYSPQMAFGLRASSADHYVTNAAYRSYVHRRFRASTVDEDSAAVAITCLSNGLPYIVLRGISNTAGGENTYSDFSALASINSVSAMAKFIGLVKSPSMRYKY